LTIGNTIKSVDGKMTVRDQKLAALELDEIPPHRNYFIGRVIDGHDDEILKRKLKHI
jgi:hypothetical protein